MRTYDDVKAAVTGKGYAFFNGELNLNMVFERTTYDATNKFDDWWHIVYQEQGVNKIISLPATTKPGTNLSLDRPVQPVVDGVVGTAVIIPGQYRGAWQFRDTTTEFLQYPYFRQVGPINYWRDNEKGDTIHQEQEQDGKIYFTHWHRMSNFNDPRSPDQLLVNNWSEGCMGTPEVCLTSILDLVRKSVAVYGTSFTGTILESADFAS